MTNDRDPYAVPEHATADEPLRDVLLRLVDNGKAYAEAEIDRQKLRAALIGSGLRTIAILVILALILTFGTLVTLMVGLIVALSPLLTPLGATAVVTAIGLVLVAILLLAARKRLRTLIPGKAE